jgi:hypothetical protein
MEYTIRRTAIERLYRALRSLGYYPIKIDGRTSEWRKGSFHLYTHQWAKRGVKLGLHKDIWEKPVPIFAHKAENRGKDIEQELQRIQQKLAKHKHAKPHGSGTALRNKLFGRETVEAAA